MPWTTTPKTSGAIAILMSLMNPSPSGFSITATFGQSMPTTMPRTRAATTCPNNEPKNRFITHPSVVAPFRAGISRFTAGRTRAAGAAQGRRYPAGRWMPSTRGGTMLRDNLDVKYFIYLI